MKLSVIIPCYNEKATVRTLLQQVCEAPLPKQVSAVEMILIDDCSKDGTRDLLQEIAAKPEEQIGMKANFTFQLIFQAENGGKGRALRRGFTAASGDIILIQDADLEYSPEDYPALLNPIMRGYADVVYGSRFIGQERRVLYFYHYLVNKTLTFLSNLFTNLNLTDMETCYKVFRKEVLDRIQLESDRFGFEPEVTAKMAKLKVRVYEVGIRYNGRTYEEGKKITWKDGLAAFWFIFKYSVLSK
jgi:glycosyltransferase involved in cell wall biosynthesis